MKRPLLLLAALLSAVPSLSAQDAATKQRLSPELLWKLTRVSGGALCPHGEHVLHSVRRYDIEKNRGHSQLMLAPLTGGEAMVLTEKPGTYVNPQFAVTPDGARVFFLAPAEGVEGLQIHAIDPKSGNRWQHSALPGGVRNLKVSPDGTHVLFTRPVKLDSTVQDLYPDLPHANARIIDGLMYRHWDAWHDFSYSHLHVARLGSEGKLEEVRDLMEGLRVDCPVPPFGGTDDIAWSPDGKEVTFVAKMVNDWAQSTDSDLYTVRLDDAQLTKRCRTHGMDGYDTHPLYSPDGSKIAFLSMKRPGFESDRNRLMILDEKTGAIREIGARLDQTAHELTWDPSGDHLWFVSEWRGTNQIFKIALERNARAEQISSGRYNHSLRAISADGKHLVIGRQSMIRPWELHHLDLGDGSVTAITDYNGEIYADLELPTIEERWVRASDGKKIHNWVIYPPGFDPKKKYPMITYCQGGPQGQIGQWFSFRWNFHLMAAQDYVVLAVNRRGLPGFGRAWNDQISKDWGGQAMRDILAATDELFAEPWVDRERTAAVGASFGGYTVYWLMGNAKDRFCTMIAHCGVFNLESMYGSTEELFFVNWDMGGPYWKSKALQRRYERFSPHRFVGEWRTPLLVIHGQKDFRVPVTQGMEAFTAAQVQGVPSRFLYFPTEGHWVLSPQNGLLWHRVFFDWLARSCK